MTGKHLFTAIALLLAMNAAGQISLSFSISTSTDTVKNYVFDGLGKDQTYYRMNYGDAKILNPDAKRFYADKKVIAIDLVYTAYPEDVDFSELNYQRIAALYAQDPNLFRDKAIKWRIIAQTGPRAKKDPYNYFHGFAIRYADPLEIGMERLKGYIDGSIAVRDSVVLKVLERNRDWKDMVIVNDVTGSMMPYIGSVLLWHQLNFKRKVSKRFVFFNDGDNAPTDKKPIGETGGIYVTEDVSLKNVMMVARDAISGGSGGDGPENDGEALLAGLEHFPKGGDLVLIADNNAPVRDSVLFEKIDKPVHIIVCGYTDKLSLQYLNLALQTGGSIHTIEQDIDGLIKENEDFQ